MSDVIARMRLESQDFDSKLKSATANLQHMEREVRRTGATFEYADKEELEFLQSLGQMETKAMDAKGKIKELSNSYKELAMLYGRMTDAEKASKPGQALAASLQQLKTRLEDTKQSFVSVSAEIGEGGGLGDALKDLGAKIGIPSQMFSTLGVAIAAAGAAIKIGTDAFKKNEVMLDDWNATIAGAQSIYESFLVSLNTGDFSGFLRRMSNVSRAAREAYDALDKLGTFNAFNQINLQRAQTQFTEAVASYREGTGSKSEVRAAADAWMNELETRRKMEQEVYLAKIREIAASRGVDADLLTKALSGSYGDYETLKATQTQMPTKSVYNSATRSFNDVIDYDAATEVQKLGQALRQLNDTQLQEIQALGRQAQATATEIAQVERQTVRMLGRSNTGGGNTASTAKTSKSSGFTLNSPYGMPETGTLADLERQVAMVRNSMSGATNAQEYQEMEAHLNTILAKIQEIKGVKEQTFTPGSLNDLNNQLKEALETLANCAPFTEEWANALADVADKQEAVAELQGQINGTSDAGVKNVRDTAAAWQNAVAAVNNVGSALQQIEDPAAKVSGIVMQAVANIALGFAQAAASPATGAAGVFGWIAAATAGLATMVSTIAAIKSATSAGSYAGGGLIGGNSYSGDNLTANVNSGELILNRAQQSSIAGQLNSNPMGNLRLSTEISGTNLRIVMNNDNRARGGQRGFYSEIH